MNASRASWIALLSLWVLGVGCGPSFQAIYEGDSRFEHCYALDEDSSVPMQKKNDCWRDWTAHYTYGQTRDRVEYATVRYKALSRVPVAPTDEAMAGAAPGEGLQNTSVTAPAPTSAFAPPPKTMEVDGGFEAGAASPSPMNAVAPPVTSPPKKAPEGTPPPADARLAPDASAAAPGEDCSAACKNTWYSCKETCKAAAACVACDKAFTRCARSCF